ncbi:MAG: glycerophosphodiester phosphodiesterase [Cyclobacteriaceae bacterium]|nr:glycerophosphodiester phosphodiesterase [Cyclobacteriaceae bacterium]
MESELTKVELHGHRGARGLMPENSIPGFIKAIELGADVLELDLVITKDRKVLVSHDPYMNATFCLDPQNNEIAKEDELKINIFEMTLEEVQQYDCGSKPHDGFPEQILQKVHKPLLSEVFEAVAAYCAKHDCPDIKYNIELKSLPEYDNIYHPEPQEYVQLVVAVVQEYLKADDLNFQSFDMRILEEIRKKHPEYELAALFYGKDTVEENLKKLSFQPEIYSPYYEQITAEDVTQLQAKGMRVIPWTVNKPKSIAKVLSWGVDGIITDYPNRVKEAQTL